MMKSLLEYLRVLLKEINGIELANVFRFKSFKCGDDFGPHRHKRIEINFIQKGACTMIFGKESVTFKENEMMIIFPFAEHSFIPHKEGVSLMQLEFMPDLFYAIAEKEEHDLSFLKEMLSENNERKYIKIINNIRLIRSVQRIIDELIDQKEFYDLLVLIYYTELLILVSRQMKHQLLPLKDGPLPQALTIIQSSFTRNISLKEIASRCGVSERYMRKLFSTQIHAPFTEYIHELRINKAKELFHHTNHSVKEVAYMCGFNSVIYFNRIFKQYTGISPGNYQSLKK